MSTPTSQRLVWALLRAVRSTLVILVIACVITAVRANHFSLSVAKAYVLNRWGLFVCVFCLVFVWDLFARKPIAPTSPDNPP